MDRAGIDREMRGEADSDGVARVPLTEIRDTLESMRARGHEDSATFQCLFQRWTRMARSEAVEWAGQLPQGALRRSMLRMIAIEWASVDPLAGGAWARNMADQLEQRELLLCVSGEAVRSDPVAALRLVAELPADAEADEVIKRAAMEWASKDAAGAMEWAEAISDESLRHAVLAAGLIEWSETAPENAAARAIEALPAGRLLEDTMASIVQRWAQADVRATAAWVEQLPEGSLRSAAIENLMSLWRQVDAVTAREWLSGN